MHELPVIRRPNIARLLLLTAVLGACRTSPPVKFYTLDPVQGKRTQDHNTGSPVQVAAVHMPPALDRRGMVRQNAPNRLSVSSENRWGAALTEITRDALTQDLSARLAPNRVVLSDAPPPKGTLALVLDILSFERTASGAVTFDGSWSLFRSGSDTPIARHELNLSEPTGSADYTEQARAMSVLLGRVADQIAEALR